MLFRGIDIAKHKHVALIVDEKGTVVKPAFAFVNDRQGFDALLSVLTTCGAPVTVGTEATGHYWLALYYQPFSIVFSPNTRPCSPVCS